MCVCVCVCVFLYIYIYIVQLLVLSALISIGDVGRRDFFVSL